MNRDTLLKELGAKEEKLKILLKKRADNERNAMRLDDQIDNLRGDIDFIQEQL